MKWLNKFFEFFISDDKEKFRLNLFKSLEKFFQITTYAIIGVAIGAIALISIVTFQEIPKKDQFTIEIILLSTIALLGSGYLINQLFKGLGFISRKLKESFINSKLWKGFLNWQKTVYSSALSFGTKFILYPRLSSLEPGISQNVQNEFTVYDNPPTPLLFNEDYCRDTISRYQNFQGRYNSLAIGLLCIGFIILCILWVLFIALLNTISETLGVIFVFIIFAIILTFSQSGITGYFDVVQLRKNVWTQALSDINKKHELEMIAQNLGSESIGRLQDQIESMMKFFEYEFLSSQEELSKKEESLKQLSVLANFTDREKESIIWLIDKKKEEEEIEQKKKERIMFRREIIKDILIGLFFFLIGLWVGR